MTLFRYLLRWMRKSSCSNSACFLFGITFAFALNTPADAADETRYGYPLVEGIYINAEGWLGWMQVERAPWAFSYTLNRWIYINSSPSLDLQTNRHGWFYITAGGEVPEDTSAPTIPTGLSVSNMTSTSLDLQWNASVDDHVVAGYKVYTNGANPFKVESNSVTITGLSWGSSYGFSVSAYDADGNESSQSSGVDVITLSGNSDTTVLADYQFASGSTFSTDGDSKSTAGSFVVSSGFSGGFDSVHGNVYAVSNTTNSTITTDQYFGFTVTPLGSNLLNLYSLTFEIGYNRLSAETGTQAAEFTVRTSLDGFTTDIAGPFSQTFANVDGGGNFADVGSIDLTSSTFQGLSAPIEFRIYVTDNSTSSVKTARLDSIQLRAVNTSDVDTQAPSVPTSLEVGNVTSNTVDLTWNMSTDPEPGATGVVGYRIYVNGSYSFSVPVANVTLSGLNPSTSYTFTVSAYDAVGNESAQSVSVNSTTGQALPQVAAPQFSPEGGIYEDTQDVTITTSTSGAIIHYTTNGTIPSQTNGIIYSGTVSLTTTTTLKAIAYKSGMSDSEVTSQNYSVGAPLYGARGAWPSKTPPPDAPADLTVSSFSELQTALRTAKSGDVIHLNSFTHNASFNFNDATAKANLATLTENVLVRPAPGATVTLDAAVYTYIQNVTWAYFKQNRAFLIRWGSDGGRLARFQMGPQATLHVTGVKDYEFVECLKPVRGLGGDTMQLGARDDKAPEDILWDSCWLEGMDVTPGDHSDTMQWLSAAGFMKFRNSYIGPAGNNSSLQMGMENQPSGVPYAVFDMDTMFLGGALNPINNGNVLGNSHTPAIYRRVEWPQVRSRTTSLRPTVLEECRFQPENPTLADGTPVKDVYPNNEFGVPVPFPTFVEPEWWD